VLLAMFACELQLIDYRTHHPVDLRAVRHEPLSALIGRASQLSFANARLVDEIFNVVSALMFVFVVFSDPYTRHCGNRCVCVESARFVITSSTPKTIAEIMTLLQRANLDANDIKVRWHNLVFDRS
jgi:hypothetical protein